MTRTLWFALFAGHIAWSAHLLVSYFVASLPCAPGGAWPGAALHVATVSTLILTVTGIVFGRAAAGVRAAPEHRFLGRFGAVLGAVLLFAIVLAGIPSAFLTPCV